MKLATIIAAVLAVTAGAPAIAQDRQQPRAETARPAPQDEVLDLSQRFLAARDAGDWDAALSMAAPEARDQMADWPRATQEINRIAGRNLTRRLTAFSWIRTRHAPTGPGLYAEVDYVATYQGVAHDCGWMLWRSQRGGPFELVMTDRNILTRRDVARLDQRTLADLLAKFRC